MSDDLFLVKFHFWTLFACFLVLVFLHSRLRTKYSHLHKFYQFVLRETTSMPRQCPFCSDNIDPKKFACRKHWASLSKNDQREVWRIYDEWKAGRLTGDDLRMKQQEIIDRNKASIGKTPYEQLGARVDDAGLSIELAKLVLEADRKRKEFIKCPPGMIDQRKRLAAELLKLETRSRVIAESIVHPDQGHGKLFDNPPQEKPKGPPH